MNASKMQVLCYGGSGYLIARLQVGTLDEAKYQARLWNRKAPADLVITLFMIDRG